MNGDEHTEVTLSRDLRLLDITMIGVGAMIGAGIFVLTGSAAGVAGPGLVLAFLLNGLVTSLTAMAYAELGSCFFEAGGGYLWVKEGMGGTAGFLSGWISWFAHSVACSLYGLGFGRFATELWLIAGLPTFGLSVSHMTLAFMTFVILLFTFINFLGASETGTVGNIVTGTKVFILLLFILFGFKAMLSAPTWTARFTEDFLPYGLGGVFTAMGLTFIAFEGYEIIAQSGEEVKDPGRNIPRAIFISIAVVVAIYILVAVVSIGAVVPPAGLKVWEYLGHKREIAIVEAASQFMPYGRVLLLLSGLASTASALNATVYSSSRVSFAMGRDRNLPAVFGQVHPTRHTPHWAIWISGLLILGMAWALPIEDVASAADILFLLLFIFVNITVMTMRNRRPDLKRSFKVPFTPYVPLLAIASNLFLAVYMFRFSPKAWYVIILWIALGLLAYWGYFAKLEAMEKPSEILLEEVLLSKRYSVLVPVSNEQQAHLLGLIGSIIAKAHDGEVLALNVAKVPRQLSLYDGRLFLKEGRPLLEAVIQEAKKLDVPVHTMIRLGRSVPEAIRKTAAENASDIIVLGWPGYTTTAGRLFGSVIDPLAGNPPTDLAIVRYRKRRPLRKILVPIAGGVNSRLAVQLACDMASVNPEPVTIVGLHVVPPRSDEAARMRGEKFIRQAFGSAKCWWEPMIVEGEDVAETILKVAREGDFDLIVIGASGESLLHTILVGDIATRVAKESPVTVIVVKRRSSPIRSFIKEALVEAPMEVPEGGE